jgi:hypothetical protein
MAEQKGIQETKELLVALGGLSVVVAQAVKGGGNAAEIGSRIGSALVANPGLIDQVKTAVAGVSEIPAELRDLSLGEIMDLCQVSIQTTKSALEALK